VVYVDCTSVKNQSRRPPTHRRGGVRRYTGQCLVFAPFDLFGKRRYPRTYFTAEPYPHLRCVADAGSDATGIWPTGVSGSASNIYAGFNSRPPTCTDTSGGSPYLELPAIGSAHGSYRSLF